MTLLLANIAGFVVAHWRWFAVAGVVLLFVFIVVNSRGCGNGSVKIDEKTIQSINSANEKERKAELQKVIEDNQDVIKTVDERTELAGVNRVEREREIDAKIAEAEKKIQEAKSQGKDVTSAELECILTGDYK